MSVYKITTKRFGLFRMADGDQERYYSLSCNENVMKFVTGYALSRDESDEMFQGYLLENDIDEHLGRYFIEDRLNNELIGAAKLDSIGEEIEIGYRIQEVHWGKGIATEIAAGLIRFAEKTIGAKKVIAFVNVNNGASIRVLEKAGMANVETIEDLDEVKYKFSYSHQTNPIMKKLLYIILGLIVLVLVAGLIMPKNYAVEREIVINKPKAEVFEYLKSLKNQDNWSVWMKMDPNIKKEYKGTDGTVGFVSMWEGNDDVGKGEQEITGISEGERINTQLRFLEPFESTSDAYMTTESAGENQTKVKWGFTGVMPYPMNAMMPMMGIEKSIGKDFSDGLQNLKVILEK
ncbi:GNAT family N-acetyltransferase [Dyadobacter psychrotolerans]|uniref:GNAT family N-acetyltransferase n=1 Tax=Dyadobacter psychrotolerans TaxID=2541721 RepID=A0A4R5DZD6_9BACT|nr:GNAT family N-acetyltransferase [Dyadobacter psychrotolerans]TDE16805.1 GNAT family N-acetyltransferase [Dyadobacter psychrotolerans]